MNSTNPARVGRNYGIDMLRIISMLLVVILHILLYGELLDVPSNTIRYYVSWLLEAFAYCAVNVFGMISGFVGQRYAFKLERVAKLWILVAFYYVLSYITFSLFNNNFNIGDFIARFFPLSGPYWYFSSYFLLMFLIPGLNWIINRLSKKKYIVVLTAIIVFSTYSCFSFKDPWSFADGYSTLWLVCLYFIGAFFAKYGVLKVKKRYLLLLYIAVSCIMFASLVGIKFIKHRIVIDKLNRTVMYNYTSILCVLQAIFLLNLFAKIRFKYKFTIKFITFFAPLSFAVFIIHMTPEIKALFMVQTAKIINYPVWAEIPIVLLIAVGVFLACAMTEHIRLMLFKIIKLDRLVSNAASKGESLIKRIIQKISLTVSSLLQQE